MKAWLRRLEIRLTSQLTKQTMIFGANHMTNKDDLTISVTGYKYMSALKDECTITITNLTQAEIVRLLTGQFYDVTIVAGYVTTGIQTIFEGGVLYISNAIQDRRSNQVIILCGSKAVAKYGQTRLNLSITSSINLFSAINFICKMSKIPNSNVSTQLKKQFLTNIENINCSAATYINNLCDKNSSLIVSTNDAANGVLSIFDAAKSDLRKIVLDEQKIILNEYPQLTNDGFILSVMPTFNFICGDTIVIDNSILQIPAYNKSDISRNYGYFLDELGEYMIYQISYTLDNRNTNFKLQLFCKSRSLISRIISDV